MVELVIRLVFSLAVVLGLLALLARVAGRRFRGGRDAMVQVVHRQPISRGATVSVVTVGSRVLVLGATEQQVRLLTELDPEELHDDLDGAEVLELVQGGSSDPSAEPVFALPTGPVAEPPTVEQPGARRARTAGAHRAAAPAGRRAVAAAPGGALSGSVLSPDTWRRAFAAASRRAS